jgi:hypothetical protein
MNGELAQCVVFTSYGNAYFHSPDRNSIIAAVSNHHVFITVKTVQFGSALAKPPESAFRQWLTSLKRRHLRRLWLVDFDKSTNLAPHLAEAFANTNKRAILAEGKTTAEIWLPHWHFTRGSKWLARYYRIPMVAMPTKLNASSAARQLKKAIRAASDFAATTDFFHWVGWFTKALDQFHAESDTFRYLPSFGYSCESRRLVNAASSAWVFGGMSSWNDMWFSNPKLQQQYEKVSEQLYEAVCNGIIAATNAFDPS